MEEAAGDRQTVVWEDRRSAGGWSGDGDGGRKASGAGALDCHSPPPPRQCSPRPGSPAGSPSATAAACCIPALQREAPTGSGGSLRPRVRPGGPPALCPPPSRLRPEPGTQQVEWTNEGLSGRALQGALRGVGSHRAGLWAPPPSAHTSPPGVPRPTTTTGTGPGATVCRTPLPRGAQVGARASGAGVGVICWGHQS